MLVWVKYVAKLSPVNVFEMYHNICHKSQIWGVTTKSWSMDRFLHFFCVSLQSIPWRVCLWRLSFFWRVWLAGHLYFGSFVLVSIGFHYKLRPSQRRYNDIFLRCTRLSHRSTFDHSETIRELLKDIWCDKRSRGWLFCSHHSVLFSFLRLKRCRNIILLHNRMYLCVGYANKISNKNICICGHRVGKCRKVKVGLFISQYTANANANRN